MLFSLAAQHFPAKSPEKERLSSPSSCDWINLPLKGNSWIATDYRKPDKTPGRDGIWRQGNGKASPKTEPKRFGVPPVMGSSTFGFDALQGRLPATTSSPASSLISTPTTRDSRLPLQGSLPVRFHTRNGSGFKNLSRTGAAATFVVGRGICPRSIL